ncbi:MAG: DUF6440 family protein [Clostridiales bacterium]|nr:DUF6440 family protein [Clostridiales bacterium]
MAKEERFLVEKRQGITQVIVDRKTGVNYLYVRDGYGGSGLTVLVDREGKPVITSVVN